MTVVTIAAVLLLGVLTINSVHGTRTMPVEQEHIYEFSMKTIDGEDRSLAAYKGKVLLIVNVASKCGYTPQYEGLQALYEKYKDTGLMILGFPANNFMWQEPGTDEEIAQFCSLEYGVTFDMFSKVSVKGSDQHPLYRFITTHPAVEGPVKWNFQKYLVNRKGEPVSKFMSGTEPLDDELLQAVEALLSESA